MFRQLLEQEDEVFKAADMGDIAARDAERKTHMFKCPECHEPIDYVQVVEKVQETASISPEGELSDFEDLDVLEELAVNCPKCKRDIAGHISHG